jgi:phage tail-like protein
MSESTVGVYQFDTADHWRIGARRNLILDGDCLVVPEERTIAPIPGTGPADAGSLPAVDACGRLTWLRPRSRELVRGPGPGDALTILGALNVPGRPRRLQIRPGLLWVLTDDGLERFHSVTRQRLSTVPWPEDWRPVDIAGDGGDGLRVLGVDRAGRWELRSVDCWGRTCLPPIRVDSAGAIESDEPVVASTAEGRWIVVLDPLASTEARVVDVRSGSVDRVGLDAVHGDGPTLLAVAAGTIHLLTTVAEPVGRDDGRAVYEALTLVGDVEDRQRLSLPASLGRPEAMVAGDGWPWIVAVGGVAGIVPNSSPTDVRLSSFITPALTSPEGARSGWNRAEIDVVLPIGTTLEVSWAATDSPVLADQVSELMARPATSGLVDEIERLLSWHDGAVAYPGVGDDPGDGPPETLAVLLDDVDSSTLWLRLRIEAPPTRVSPSLSGLRVRYPDISYLDHLPAIYREHPASARRVRGLLAPYEILLDDLDQTLTSLPGRVDPATAPDDWSAYLLRWLGFPPLSDLPADRRRALLDQSPTLLDLRGTAEGLRLVLDLVTGGRATVTDAGDRPAGWVLTPAGATADPAARPTGLGIDSVVLAQRPASSRAGTMTLGRTPLGRGCPDPVQVLADRAGVVTVHLELTRDEQERLQPMIDRLLPVFVPAHCRLQLITTGSDGADRTRSLDVDFRLAGGEGECGPNNPSVGPTSPRERPFDALLYGDGHWRLGTTARLGWWRLAEPSLPPLVLGHRARLGAGPRLH